MGQGLASKLGAHAPGKASFVGTTGAASKLAGPGSKATGAPTGNLASVVGAKVKAEVDDKKEKLAKLAQERQERATNRASEIVQKNTAG